MNKLTYYYNRLGEIGLDLFILNFYWIVFTLMGGVVFGIIPSTVALYTCIRHRSKYNTYLTKRKSLFVETYKKEFFNSNKILTIFLLWLFIYIDYRLLTLIDLGIFNLVMPVVLFVSSILLLLMTIYIVPIYVNYKGSIREHMKKTIILIIGKPKETLFTLLLLLIIFSIYYTFPGLVPVFGISIYSFISLNFILKDVLLIDRELEENYIAL